MAREVKFGRFGTWWADAMPAVWHRMTFARNTQDDITFRLSGNRYRFDTRDPIWVQEDTGSCPPASGLHEDFEIIRPVEERKLTVRNKNVCPQTLRYQLNVIDTRTNQPLPIDPIMRNEGRV